MNDTRDYNELIEEIGNGVVITTEYSKNKNYKYNFCLEKKDIGNLNGSAVNKITNTFIRNIYSISDTCSSKVKYLATHYAVDEGSRHYFLIELEEPYKDLLLQNVKYLPVYISTGVNTGSICSKNKCIIPFFGVATIKAYNYTPSILKSDFFNAFSESKNFDSVKKYYITEDKNEKNKLENKIGEYFQKKFEPKTMNSYKKKVGSNFFMDIIVKNKKDIFNIINAIELDIIPTKKISYIHELNLLIDKNNFTGYGLHRFEPTKILFKDDKYFQELMKTKKITKKKSIENSPYFSALVRFLISKN